jgi:hypothetical protein
VFRFNQILTKPFSDDVSNIMGLNAASATMDTPWVPGPLVDELNIGPLKTVEEVLTEKLALPAT